MSTIRAGCEINFPLKSEFKNLTDTLSAQGININLIHLAPKNSVSKSGFSGLSDDSYSQESDFQQLRDESVDFLLFHLPDVPVNLPEDLVIGALISRVNPAECILVNKENFDATADLKLKNNTITGVRNELHAAQINSLNNTVNIQIHRDLNNIHDLFNDGLLDAIVIPQFTIEYFDAISGDTQIIKLHPKEFIPTPGQGVTACVCLRDNIEVRKILRTVHKSEISECTNTERNILKMALKEGMKNTGAFCTTDQHRNLHVYACIIDPESGKLKKAALSQSTTKNLSENLFQSLLRP